MRQCLHKPRGLEHCKHIHILQFKITINSGGIVVKFFLPRRGLDARAAHGVNVRRANGGRAHLDKHLSACERRQAHVALHAKHGLRARAVEYEALADRAKRVVSTVFLFLHVAATEFAELFLNI